MNWNWSSRATRLFEAFPRQVFDESGYGFIAPEDMPARFERAGFPVFEAVVAFQRELAGCVFYDGPRTAPYTPYLWGIQTPTPDNDPGEPYEDECVVLTDAAAFTYVMREDGRIEVDGQVDATSARVMVEGQALQYEWDAVIRPGRTAYFLRLDARPRDDAAYWRAVADAAARLGLNRVEEASDVAGQWYVGPHSRLSVEPYYGTRNFSDDVPARWARLFSTSIEEAQAFHALVRDAAGWGTLQWRKIAPEYPDYLADYSWAPPF